MRDKFLADLRQIRQTYEGDEMKLMLDRIRIRLDNPEILAVETVLNMLLSYRFLSKSNQWRIGNELKRCASVRFDDQARRRST